MKKGPLLLLGILYLQTVHSQNLLSIPDTLNGNLFNLHVKDTSHEFYQNISTGTMAVNASYLGPTLLLNKGDSVVINVFNDLMDSTTIHWHGLHVSPVNDGGPHSIIPPGTVWSPSFKVLNNASTYWYHPHLHMMTNMHTTLGVAGMIIVRDSNELLLNLPRKYGVDDFPLVLQSKCFDNLKQIVVGNHSDSVLMVNGVINPYLEVPAQVIRFRVLNASSDRAYQLGINNNMTFYQISTDGGLLNAPVALTRVRISPGERLELLIDLSAFNGQNLQLINYGSEIPSGIYGSSQPGMGPGLTANLVGYSSNTLNGNNHVFLDLHVVNPTLNPVTTIPASLYTNSPYSVSSANVTRSLTFTSTNNIVGPFLINGATFEMNTINYHIPLNNIEVWTLSNQSPIAHPFHIHDVQFYITDVNGSIPPANMQGKKDMVLVMPMQTVSFITKFETFCNDTMPFIYHCHMLPHEDSGMMGQFIVDCSANDVEEFTEKNTLVAPNPAHGFLQIIGEKNVGIIIYNYSGIEVLRQFPASSFIDISSLSSGLYFVKIKSKDTEFIQKIIIEQ